MKIPSSAMQEVYGVIPYESFLLRLSAEAENDERLVALDDDNPFSGLYRGCVVRRGNGRRTATHVVYVYVNGKDTRDGVCDITRDAVF